MGCGGIILEIIRSRSNSTEYNGSRRYIYEYIYEYTYIYINTYICIYTYVYIYIYIYSRNNSIEFDGGIFRKHSRSKKKPESVDSIVSK
jgi:hypothetical protein